MVTAFVPIFTADIDEKPIFSNEPRKRAKLITHELLKSGISIIPFLRYDQSLLVELLLEKKMVSIDYLHFLENAWNDASKENDPDWFIKNQLIPAYFPPRSVTTIPSDLPLYKHCGFYCSDQMTPITSHTYNDIMLSLWLVFQAFIIFMDENNNRKVTYILTPSPGHHAGFNEAGGYCFINNAVFLARLLSSPPSFINTKHHRVALLDLDYHSGNHSEISDFLAISIHGHPKYEYPSYLAYPDEFNLCPPAKANLSVYKEYLAKAIEMIAKANVEYLVIAFGADTYKHDPDPRAGYGFDLEIDDYGQLGAMIKTLGLEVFVCQEGGYNLEAVPLIVRNFLQGLS